MRVWGLPIAEVNGFAAGALDTLDGKPDGRISHPFTRFPIRHKLSTFANPRTIGPAPLGIAIIGRIVHTGFAFGASNTCESPARLLLSLAFPLMVD
jgi:hypothetical protein